MSGSAIEVGPQAPRRHPDLFTADEAAVYLHLDPEAAENTLETLRYSHGLIGQKVGRSLMYHRRSLDALVDRLFGIDGSVAGRIRNTA